MDKTDISLLLQVPDDITFVKRAYQEFLSRPIAFQDLTEHLKLLKIGMSRKAMLYCIVRSPEFDNRFAVPELKSLHLAYFLYLLQKPVLSILKSNKKAVGNSPYCSKAASSQKTAFSTYHNPNLEYEVLSRCQISVLSSALASYIDSKDVCYSGSIAKTILNENGNLSARELIPDELWNAYSFKAGTCILTDPASIYYLLTGEGLSALADHLNDYCIFTMPATPFPSDSVSIIWGKEWETLDDDTPYKWFVSEGSLIPLVLYNNSNTIQKITLKFSLTSLENCSEIIASFNGMNYKRYSFQSNISLEVEETFYLHPFYNQITFSYIGAGVSSDEMVPLSIKFAISPPVFRKKTENLPKWQPIYSINSTLPAAEDYRFILPDFMIRYLLHKNSFFEVAALHISDDYQCQKLPVTRFDYSSRQENKKGYYTFIENSVPALQNGIILYIAKRKAEAANTYSDKEVL